MTTTLEIDDQPLSLGELRKAWEGPVRVSLGDAALVRVRAAQAKASTTGRNVGKLLTEKSKRQRDSRTPARTNRKR